MDPIDLVGTPYDKEHECRWLVRTVIKAEKGIELPDKMIGWRRFGKTVDWPTEVERCNLIFFSSNELKIVDHVGVAISNTDFLHASHAHGQVVCEPILKYAARIISIGKLHDS